MALAEALHWSEARDPRVTTEDVPRAGILDMDSSSALETDFAARLRCGGLRVTRPRLLVLHLLHATPGHHSADDIVALLAARDTPLPRASVYNVVSALVDCGLVTMVSVGPGCARYEYGTPWHHHFVCKMCGSIQDVCCVVGDKPCLTPPDVDGSVDEAQITFRGVCSACQSAGTP